MSINKAELFYQYRNRTLALMLTGSLLIASGCGGSSSSSDSSSEEQPQEQEQPQDLVTFSDIAGSDFYKSASNSALLSGPVVGTASVDNASLVKELQFELFQTSSPIEIQAVYMTRKSESDGRPAIVVVIRNNSESIECFVRMSEFQLLDNAGTVLEEQPNSNFFFASGSHGFSGTTFTNTCLVPGEMGYAIYSDSSFDFVGIGMVSFGAIETSSGYSSATQVVLPLTYQVNESNVDITIANQSSESLIIDSTYEIILLDEQGLPIAYVDGFQFPDFELGPGAEAILMEDFEFAGSSSTLRVILDFGPIEPET